MMPCVSGPRFSYADGRPYYAIQDRLHGRRDVYVGQRPRGGWATFCEDMKGNIRRFTSPRLPTRETAQEAQRDLDRYIYDRLGVLTESVRQERRKVLGEDAIWEEIADMTIRKMLGGWWTPPSDEEEANRQAQMEEAAVEGFEGTD